MNNKIFLVLLFALFLSLCVRTYQRSAGTDFESTYNTATRIVQNQPIYNTEEGMHGLMWSPFYATLVTPLGIFGAKVASLLFFIISFAATILSFILLTKVFPLELPFLLIAISLSGRFILDNFMYGQINTFMLLCISLFIYMSRKYSDKTSKKGRILYLLSYSFIVIASSIKVFPSIFVLTYYPKKIKQSLIGLCIGLLVIFLVPVFFFGVVDTARLFYEWQTMLSSSFQRMPLDHYGNQSITAMFTRFFGYNNSVIRTGIVCSLSLGVVIFILAFKKSLLKKVSLITIASIIISPIVWKHTLTLLVIPNIYIALRLQKNKLNEFKGIKAVLLVLYIILGTFTANGFIGNKFGVMSMNANLILFAVISLGAYILLSNENLSTNTQTGVVVKGKG